jgi:hypothetical protein
VTAGQPTTEQLRAVREALEKFCGLGRWSHLTGYRLTEPFLISWDRSDFPRARAAGVCATFATHSEICLRSDLSPTDLHRVTLHELTHVFCAPWIRAGVDVRWLEQVATNTAARLAALP